MCISLIPMLTTFNNSLRSKKVRKQDCEAACLHTYGDIVPVEEHQRESKDKNKFP